jgi:SAM-dependent methyltransferase
MAVADMIRRAYELRPYPAAGRRVASAQFAHLPPLVWVQALGRPGAPAPRRVLVAGCGTGAEAFEMRRELPDAEILAIDFSPRSIAIARRVQRAARLRRPIEFVVADLNDPQLADRTGGNFDFISCHGVLTYLPAPEQVLRNLADCLQSDGVLYLGVNGTGHPGDPLRQWLNDLGFPTAELHDERRLRSCLRLWDRLQSDPTLELAKRSATFLAGDICGPHFNNWSLARWRDTAARAGWRLAASGHAPAQLRRTLDDAAYRPLYPVKLDEMAVHLDGATPASFHRLLLRRAPADAWTWDGTEPAVPCDVRWTGLYSLRLTPARRGGTVWATLRSSALLLQLEWPLSEREAAAVRTLARARSGGVAWPAGWPRTETVRRTLWLWAGFGVITVG